MASATVILSVYRTDFTVFRLIFIISSQCLFRFVFISCAGFWKRFDRTFNSLHVRYIYKHASQQVYIYNAPVSVNQSLMSQLPNSECVTEEIVDTLPALQQSRRYDTFGCTTGLAGSFDYCIRYGRGGSRRHGWEVGEGWVGRGFEAPKASKGWKMVRRFFLPQPSADRGQPNTNFSAFQASQNACRWDV